MFVKPDNMHEGIVFFGGGVECGDHAIHLVWHYLYRFSPEGNICLKISSHLGKAICPLG
jgi:hypothetical protein